MWAKVSLVLALTRLFFGGGPFGVGESLLNPTPMGIDALTYQ